jgi:ABC-type antimicrobial peptide transport system permease subunit
VLRHGLRLTVAGLALGLALAFMLTQFLRGLFYGVSATDPATVVIVVALLSAITLLACYLPARRAMHLNPVNAMRTQ